MIRFLRYYGRDEDKMVLILLIAACFASAVIMYKRWLNLTDWDSPHWNSITKQFQHPWRPNHRIMSLKILWEFINAPAAKWPKKVIVNPRSIASKSEELRITNIGHATFLIQMAGINIITDPVFSNRAGPLGIFGPKRVSAPGLSLELIPPIDIAFISHNHYDHLDKFSVINLAQFHNITFVVPLGMKRQLLKWGITRPIVELDWWQVHEVNGINITATPAQHWSRRGLFDINKTLWMGGVFESSKGSVFFAGDTGLGPHFSQIADRIKMINVGLLPIGSYKPRSVMKAQHMGPSDALSAHQDLKTETMIPIHYDVFPLGKESFLEAERELISEAKILGIPKNQIEILKVGESYPLMK